MKFDPEKTIFLIDGSSFLYRSYYGLRPIHTSQGEPVQAVYSFCRMMKKLMNQFNPHYMALVWDSKGKTTRHEMYQDYKATRQDAPTDIFEQKDRILEFADRIDLHQVSQPGIEADDIMYSIAQDYKKKGYAVVLITSDKDMAQALDNTITIYDSLKDKFITPESFLQEKGFSVDQIPFYFSLVGDSSDNIPGVRGIGEKGATELVQQFGSLEDLYANLEQVKKPRMRTALQENEAAAFLSRKLFLLQYHASDVTLDDLRFDINNWINARPLFEELEFKTLLKELEKEGGPSLALDKIQQLEKLNLVTLTTPEQLDALVQQIKEKKAFAVDTEGTNLDVYKNELVGISIAVDAERAYYIPFGHTTGEQQLSREHVLSVLKPVLEDATIEKYLHHAKYDMLVFHCNGIELQGLAFDSLVAARLVVQDWQRIGLKHLSESVFQEPMLTFDDVVKAHKYTNFSEVPLALATLYSAMDARQTLKLKHYFVQALEKDGMAKLYYELELPLVSALYNMEKEGIYCDASLLEHLNEKVSRELEHIERSILVVLEDGQTTLNLNSPKQIEDLLFNRLKLPPQKKSAKGTGYSTDAQVLRTLAVLHPVPAMILRYRELYKLKSTYIEALPTYINTQTGRIHTSFSQTAVATGRLASSDPNLQNVPASGEGLEIRAAFKPQEGNVFISADYSQIELRVLAFLSQDQNLLNAFLQGHDIHAETAARLFDTTLDTVTHDQRQIGKRINFSILYGLTPYGLSKDLDIPFKDAKTYIEKYFAQYPGVSRWMEGIIAAAKEHGYVQTYWGRKRYVPTIHETNRTLYDEACRIAINTVAQGTAAEIMKFGMLKVQEAFKQQRIDAQMVLQIHDELLITARADQREQAERVLQQTLESVVDWSVPLKVTTRFGADWKEITK